MSGPKLLPPHTDAAATAPAPDASSSASGTDASAFIKAQRAVPKRPYGPAEGTSTQEPPKTDPPKPEGAPEGGQEPPKDGQPSPDSKASAKEFIETYDLLQSFGFSQYSDGLPMERFALPAPVKERAIHHLARGMASMGNPELPWPVGVAMALTPPAFFNWLMAKENRAEQRRAKDQERRNNAAKARSGDPIQPTVIYDMHGNVVGRDAGQRKAPEAPPPVPAKPFTPPTVPASSPKVYGQCRHCGNDLLKRGRTYCSQSCAGKATKGSTRTAPKPAEEHGPTVS